MQLDSVPNQKKVWFTDRSRVDPNEAPGDRDHNSLIAQLKKNVEACMNTKLNGESRKEKYYGDISTNMHHSSH